MTDAPNVFQLIGYIETDLRSIHAKFTELRSQLAALNLPPDKPKPRCPQCNIQLRRDQIQGHLERVHGAEPVRDDEP